MRSALKPSSTIVKREPAKPLGETKPKPRQIVRRDEEASHLPFPRIAENGHFFVVLGCFFFSGAAGLIYAVVCSRMLTQVFGNTTHAIVAVLAAFMTGLALGSYFFGRVADRGKNNFLLYGLLETGVGIYGFAVPWLFQLARAIYFPLFRLSDSYPFLFSLLLFFLSFALLFLPTVLMGATLPVLSRFFARSFDRLGRRIGDLYATNTIGAMAGCALAGYYLIPAFGMRKTVYIAATLNLAIAVVIIAIDRLRRKEPVEQFLAPATAPQQAAPSLSSPGWILLASFGLSGFTALVYGYSWSRVLTLVIGSSFYSFTAILSTFLAGLALGGFLYARVLGGREIRTGVFAAVELGIGLTALATIPLFERLPLIFLRLLQALGDSFPLFLFLQVLLSALVMFLPTFLLGMTFPLVVRLFTQSLDRVGGSVGACYAANTVGAILGTFAAGFIFIPWIGVQNSLIVAAAINLLVGSALTFAAPRLTGQHRFAVAAVVLALLVVLPVKMPRWDRSVLTSGVTIYADLYKSLPTDSLRLETMRSDELLYYREGMNATVSVHRSASSEIYFKTNGKIDGSNGDALTQLMIGYIPLLLHPEAKQAAIVGLGTGMAAKAVGAFPVTGIDVIEIEPAMAEAARFFNDHNGNILADLRMRLVLTDARSYILAAPKRYDVIAAEPSSAWIAGTANLYTREFYEAVKSHLEEDGIFAQWFRDYSMSPADFRMVLSTFGEAFPQVSVWGLQAGDLLLVGSKKEQSFDYPRLKELSLKDDALRGDLKSLGLSDVYAVMGFYRMGKKELMNFAGGAGVNTDDGSQLEFSAPRSLNRDAAALNRKLMESFWVEAPWLREDYLPRSLSHYYLAESYLAQSSISHSLLHRAAHEIDEAIHLEPSNPDFHLLKTKVLLAEGDTEQARRSALLVLERSPNNVQSIVDMSASFDAESAKTIFEKAVKLGTQEIAVFVGLGNIALYYRNLKEAERWLDQASRIDPHHPTLLRALGQLMFFKGEFQKAKDLLEQAKERGENSAALYNGLGVVYTELGLWDRAVNAYSQTLKFPGPSIERRRYLAVALANAGRLEEAEKKFREVLALSPGDVEAGKGLEAIGKAH